MGVARGGGALQGMCTVVLDPCDLQFETRNRQQELPLTCAGRARGHGSTGHRGRNLPRANRSSFGSPWLARWATALPWRPRAAAPPVGVFFGGGGRGFTLGFHDQSQSHRSPISLQALRAFSGNCMPARPPRPAQAGDVPRTAAVHSGVGNSLHSHSSLTVELRLSNAAMSGL